MALKIAVQMDPIATINIDSDSTFLLMLESQRRGHKLYYYLPRDLSFTDNRVTAIMHSIELRREKGNHFTLGPAQKQDLSEFDAILMRQDPPFDMAYITATHILEHIHPQTLVINDPAEVRNAPEKLFVTRFPNLMPPTLISSRREDILEFRTRHKDIILKPLYGNGGSQVFHIDEHSDNLNALIEMFTAIYKEPIVTQAYLPQVREGDKRVVLIDGKIAGAVNRIPPKGDVRANLHIGGQAAKTELTARDREICETIGPELSKRGLLFVGIDIIGDYLTEINVTSPTTLQSINRLYDTHIERVAWDCFEQKIAQRNRKTA